MIISFAIDSTAPTSLQCSKLQADKTSEAVAALKAKLGASGSIEATDYSLSPRAVPGSGPAVSQSSRTSGEWEFSDNLEVDSDSVSELAPIISVATASAPGVTISGSGYRRPYPFVYTSFNAHVPVAVPPHPTKQSAGKPHAFIMFRIETRAGTPEQAIKLGSQKAAKVEKALMHRTGKSTSITITPSSFWIQPVNQGYRPPQRPPARRIYYAHTTLEVRTKRLDSLGALIQAGLANGVSHVYSVTFTLSNKSAGRKKAIAAAARDAQSNARSIATSMGVKLGKILTISTNAQVQPGMLEGGTIENAIGTLSRTSAASIEQSLTPVLPRRIGLSAYLKVVYEID